MIPMDKFKPIFQRLLERSRKGEVEWLQDAALEDGFKVHLPESVLRIHRVTPRIDPDYYQLELYNKEGVRLMNPVAEIEDQANEWLPLLSALFEEAFRCRTGWDKVLADLEAAVSAEAHVGVPMF